MSDRYRLRLKFKKTGNMKFIGHLDVMRFFQKLIRRAGLDVAYSEGFHPHQLLSFANPLGVGLMSEGEYADVVMNTEQPCDEIIRSLNAVSAEGFEITGAVYLQPDAMNGMASVAMADYLVSPEEPVTGLSDACSDILGREMIEIEKRTKKGSRNVDIRPGIKQLSCRENGDIFMRLSAGSVLNIRPEQVFSVILNTVGVDHDIPVQITRLEQYDEQGRSLLES